MGVHSWLLDVAGRGSQTPVLPVQCDGRGLQIGSRILTRAIHCN